MPVAFEGFGVRGFHAIELRAFEQHLADSINLGAMRIFYALALGVVLAVYRRPLFSDHAGRKPEPETKEMARQRMKLQGAVGLVAMQVDCDGGDSDMGYNERVDHISPPWQNHYKHAASLSANVPDSRGRRSPKFAAAATHFSQSKIVPI